MGAIEQAKERVLKARAEMDAAWDALLKVKDTAPAPKFREVSQREGTARGELGDACWDYAVALHTEGGMDGESAKALARKVAFGEQES